MKPRTINICLLAAGAWAGCLMLDYGVGTRMHKPVVLSSGGGDVSFRALAPGDVFIPTPVPITSKSSISCNPGAGCGCTYINGTNGVVTLSDCGQLYGGGGNVIHGSSGNAFVSPTVSSAATYMTLGTNFASTPEMTMGPTESRGQDGKLHCTKRVMTTEGDDTIHWTTSEPHCAGSAGDRVTYGR